MQALPLRPLIYLWDDRFLYIGPLPENGYHKLLIGTLSINLDQSFKVSIDHGKDWKECRSVYWPPGVGHESIYGTDIMVFLMIEPVSRDGHIIENRMRFDEGCYFHSLRDEQHTIETLREIYHSRPSSEDARRLVNMAINPNHSTITQHYDHIPDRRICRVIDTIRSEPSSRVSIEELADIANISKHRLMHLFQEQTGMSIGRFINWQMMKNVVRHLPTGKTLSEAALLAGFTDAAHFSRMFKKVAGMTPSSVLLTATGLEIVTDWKPSAPRESALHGDQVTS